MPPQAGDQVLLTIASTQRHERHDRFEQGSYFYVYHNEHSGQARIEIANNAGTPDQDAIEGTLDNAHVKYSYTRPCYMRVQVMRQNSHTPPGMWTARNYDMQHQRENMYALQTLDLYFWTPEDAAKCVDALRLVHVASFDVQSPPPAAHQRNQSSSMSPVVQKLEQAAITTPYNQDGRSTASTTHSMPRPQRADTYGSNTSQGSTPAPAAYNPAAPTAPEPIAHREKTPPVEDTPGASAPYTTGQLQQQYAHGQSPPPGPVQRTGSFPPPPSGQASGPHPGMQRVGSYPPTATQPYSPGQQSFGPQIGGSFGPQAGGPYVPGQPTNQYASNPASPGFSAAGAAQSPLGSPTALPSPPQHGSAPQSPPQHQQQQQQQKPQGYDPQIHGYATYNYANAPGGQPASAHDIHAQAYRPTEAEAGAHGSGNQAAGLPNSGEARGRFEKGIGSAEKRVTSFLKRLDKKL